MVNVVARQKTNVFIMDYCWSIMFFPEEQKRQEEFKHPYIITPFEVRDNSVDCFLLTG